MAPTSIAASASAIWWATPTSPAAARSAAVVCAGRPQHRDPVGAVPVRRAETGRRRHDDRVRPAPIGRGRLRHSAAPGRCRRSTPSALPALAPNASSAYVRPSPPACQAAVESTPSGGVGRRRADVQPQEGAGAQRERRHPRPACSPGRRAPPAGRRAWPRRAPRTRPPPRRCAGRTPSEAGSRAAARAAPRTGRAGPRPSPATPRSTSSVRQALDGSVTWPAPPERCRASQQATSPKRSSPLPARRSSAGSASNSQRSLGAEKVGSSASPVTPATRSAPARPASAGAERSARWSCQLIDRRHRGSPVARPTATNVSVWLAMPMAPPRRRPQPGLGDGSQHAGQQRRRGRARPSPGRDAVSPPGGRPPAADRSRAS